jgi:hypothetical protein
MRYICCILVVLLLLCLMPVLAQHPAQNGVLALVDSRSLVSFAPGNPASSIIGDISDVKMPEEIDALSVNLSGYMPDVSPDGQWLVWTEHFPATLVYGRTGGETIFVPLAEEKSLYATQFSPDSRYLSYLQAAYGGWTLGLVELASGKVIEFTGETAMIPPDLDKSLPFGYMAPNPIQWSADGKTIYTDTFMPEMGCRGPHDLYALDISDIDSDEAAPTLPPTTEIATLGDDTLSFAFSPDLTQLAYAYQGESCGSPNNIGIALVDLATGENRTIAESEDLMLHVTGWTRDGAKLIYAEGASMGPASDHFPSFATTLHSYDVASGEAVELPALHDAPARDATGDFNTDYRIEEAAAGTNTLVFAVIDELDQSQTLYRRVLTGSTESRQEILKGSQLAWRICEDTLYYVQSGTNGIELYSLPLDDAGEPTLLHEAESIRLLTCGTVQGA